MARLELELLKKSDPKQAEQAEQQPEPGRVELDKQLQATPQNAKLREWDWRTELLSQENKDRAWACLQREGSKPWAGCKKCRLTNGCAQCHPAFLLNKLLVQEGWVGPGLGRV